MHTFAKQLKPAQGHQSLLGQAVFPVVPDALYLFQVAFPFHKTPQLANFLLSAS